MCVGNLSKDIAIFRISPASLLDNHREVWERSLEIQCSQGPEQLSGSLFHDTAREGQESETPNEFPGCPPPLLTSQFWVSQGKSLCRSHCLISVLTLFSWEAICWCKLSIAVDNLTEWHKRTIIVEFARELAAWPGSARTQCTQGFDVHSVIQGHLKAGCDLLAGGWDYLKACSHVWHLTLPVAGILSRIHQPEHLHVASTCGCLPFLQGGGWVPRVSVLKNKAENTWDLYNLALNVIYYHTLLVEVTLIQFLETFFFDSLLIKLLVNYLFWSLPKEHLSSLSSIKILYPFNIFLSLSLCSFLCLSSTYDLFFCILNSALLKIDLNSATEFLLNSFLNSAAFFILF